MCSRRGGRVVVMNGWNKEDCGTEVLNLLIDILIVMYVALFVKLYALMLAVVVMVVDEL